MAVCVFSTVNETDAGLVKTALDERGINNYIRNSSSLAYLRANLSIGSMEVYVEEKNADIALEIVKTLFDDEDEDNQIEENTDQETDNEELDDASEVIPRKRAPFASIWLIFSLVVSIIVFFFSQPLDLIFGFYYYQFWYIASVIALMLLGITGIILMLKWKKIGFFIYTGARIIDLLAFMILTNNLTIDHEIILGISGILIMYFALRSKNKYGKSTWEQME